MFRKQIFMRIISAFILAVFVTAGVAMGDQYPSRPITLIVPWGAGGGSDQMARAVAKQLENALKTTSVPVVNVPGADGNNGMVKLLSDDADGYSMAALVADTFYGNITTKSKVPWELKDIIPLAVMNSQPFTFFVAKNSPYNTWADVEKAAKSTQLKIAIDGFGSAEDVLVKFVASKGVKLIGVPYPKPGERYAALLGNQIDLMCDPDGNVKGYVDGGQMRPLIVFSTKRVPEMSGVPTGAELGYNVALGEWRALVVKAGTNPSRVEFLSNALAKVYKSPGFQQFLKSTWSEENSYVPRKDVPGFLHTKQQQIERILQPVH